MNLQQLELTRLLGKKELTFGCYIKYEWEMEEGDEPHIARFVEYEYFANESTGLPVYETSGIFTFTPPSPYGFEYYAKEGEYEIIGHPATLRDLHRWMTNRFHWTQDSLEIQYGGDDFKRLEYDSSKDLLDQSEETLENIIELIKIENYKEDEEDVILNL